MGLPHSEVGEPTLGHFPKAKNRRNKKQPPNNEDPREYTPSDSTTQSNMPRQNGDRDKGNFILARRINSIKQKGSVVYTWKLRCTPKDTLRMKRNRDGIYHPEILVLRRPPTLHMVTNL